MLEQEIIVRRSVEVLNRHLPYSEATTKCILKNLYDKCCDGGLGMSVLLPS